MDMQSHDRLALRVRQPKAAHVLAPAKHEGVANALRSAYIPYPADLPADFAELLEKLS